MVAKEKIHHRMYDAPPGRHSLLVSLHLHHSLVFVQVFALVELSLDPRQIVVIFLIGANDHVDDHLLA
jgi:hypothetical protein